MSKRFAPLFAIVAWVVFLIPAEAAQPEKSAAATSDEGLEWHDLRELEIEGKGWTETKAFYDRLPAKAEGMLPEAVWGSSRRSTGMCARFTTDAQAIHARWTLAGARLGMPHMPATGVSGLDLYVRDAEGAWRWLGVGRAETIGTNQAELVKSLLPGQREYLLYLPLYNTVASVEIGVEHGRSFAKALPRPASRMRPILFYGTSITQGGCASRPGMVHTAILGRRFDRPVINLGFSGEGKMEPAMATLLAELDPAVYVLECLPNMSIDEISERAEPLVRTLRAAHPRTPILMVEDRTRPDAFLRTDQQQKHKTSRAAWKAVYDKLISSGITGLHYFAGDKLLAGGTEVTVDGSHLNDLGFMIQADAMEPALRSLLATEARK